MVRVLNLFTGDTRRTPLIPRKVVPEKQKYVNCFVLETNTLLTQNTYQHLEKNNKNLRSHVSITMPRLCM